MSRLKYNLYVTNKSDPTVKYIGIQPGCLDSFR